MGAVSARSPRPRIRLRRDLTACLNGFAFGIAIALPGILRGQMVIDLTPGASASRPAVPRNSPPPSAPAPKSPNPGVVNLTFNDAGKSITIVRGLPIVTSAHVDNSSLIGDFYFETEEGIIPEGASPPGTPAAQRETHRFVRWFPRTAGIFTLRPVLVSNQGVTMKESAPLTVHVIEPTLDPTLPLFKYRLRGIGFTEISVSWSKAATALPGSAIFLERRGANESEWHKLGPFNEASSNDAGSTVDGNDLRYIIDHGLRPGTEYVYRFTYLTPDGRLSPTSPDLRMRTISSLRSGPSVVYVPADVEQAISVALSDVGRGVLSPRNFPAPPSRGSLHIGNARVIAMNLTRQVVIEQELDGIRGFWFWELSSGLREIPSGPAERGKFMVSGLREDGMVNGTILSPEKSNPRKMQSRSATWDPRTGLATMSGP